MKNRFLFYVFLSGIILNISGYYLGNFIKMYVNFFIFLDSSGTILSGILYGPVIGAITGLTSNLILGVADNLVKIPFAAVNIATGLTAGFISDKYGFRNFKSLLHCICSVTLVNAFIGAVVAFFVFGGVTGEKIDLKMIGLTDAGIFMSSFLVRIPVNFIDKSISCAAAFFIAIKFSGEKKI